MGFLARVHADGRGSAKAGGPMARLAGQDGNAEASVPTDPAFSDPILEAGPIHREGVDPFSADPGPFPALVGADAPGEETMPSARPAMEARLSADVAGWSQALAGAAAGETGPEVKPGMRSLPATRSYASGKEPAADRPVPGPHTTVPEAAPAGFHPVTDAVRNRGPMEDGGKKSDGAGAAHARPAGPKRTGAPSAMGTGGFPASLPEAALPTRALDPEAGSEDAVSPVSATKGAIPAAPRPGSGDDSLDKALGAISRTLSRTQKDRSSSSASFDTQGNYTGTRNTEGTYRPQPPPGPRVVIGSLQIRVEAPAPAPAAPQESAAAARSRSYRVEW